MTKYDRTQQAVRVGLLVVAGVCGPALRAADQPRIRITRDNVASLRVLEEIDEDVMEIEWHGDGIELAFVRWELPVQIRDPFTFKLRGTWGEGRRIIHFAFGKDLDVIAYCENNESLHLISAETIESIEIPTGNPQPHLCFSPDGKYLAGGGYGTLARVWSVPDGRLLHELDVGMSVGGLTPQFSPDGRILAVGNRNGETCLFDVAAGRLRHRLRAPSTQGLAFSPDGKVLAITYVDASVALWQVESGELLRRTKTGAGELYEVDWSPAGDLLVTSGLAGPITLWDPRDLSLLRELPAPEWVIEVKFNPDGTRLLSSGGGAAQGEKRSVQVWGVGPA